MAASKKKSLTDPTLREVQDFFVNYHRLEGTQHKLLGCRGEQPAWQLVKKAKRAA